jgi:hypothetical protein
MPGIGRRLQLGIAKEASRGSAEATVDFWLPTTDLSIDHKAEKVVDEQAYGVIEDSIGSYIVRKFAEGNFSAHLATEDFPLILLSVLGSLSSAQVGGETVVYDHTFGVSQSTQHQSLTLFLNDPIAGQDYKYPLGVVENT